MKRIVILMMCVVLTTCLYAQKTNVRQIALNYFKSTLIAPSQFVLTDIYGNRISTSQIKASYCKLEIKYDTIRHYCSKVGFDSVEVEKLTYPACYEVKIIGDGRNRAGGYEQMIEYIYVYNGRGYEYRPYNSNIIDTYIKEEKNIQPPKHIRHTAFDVVEEMPQFPGGQAALLEYIEKNMKYPVVAEENGIQGRVIVTFVVESDGSITNVKVIKSVDPSLDKEAERIVKCFPKWQAGKQNGKCVPVKYTVPVQFKLK